MEIRKTVEKSPKTNHVWYALGCGTSTLTGPFKTKKELNEFIARGSSTYWLHTIEYKILKVHSLARCVDK